LGREAFLATPAHRKKFGFSKFIFGGNMGNQRLTIEKFGKRTSSDLFPHRRRFRPALAQPSKSADLDITSEKQK
jgi:hypothetical protein